MPDWEIEIRRRMAGLKLSPVRESEIAEELAQHLDDRYQELLADGASDIDAERLILAELSENELFSELQRVERKTPSEPIVTGTNRRINMVVDIWNDLRFGIRMLLKRPGFTAIAVITLALGIGASTAIFSAVNPILFESLPYPDASQIVTITDDFGINDSSVGMTFGTYRELVQRSRSFSAIAVARPWQPAMTGSGEPERLEGQRVSASYFQVLGVSPALGSNFNSSDDRPNGPSFIIISEGLWQRRFNAESGIVGRQVTLNGSNSTVIGVMPRAFENVLSPKAEVWTLLKYDTSLPSFDGREWGRHLRMVGRLKPGVGTDQARSELNTIARTPLPEFPRPRHASLESGMLLISLQDQVTRGVKPALMAVLGAVVLLLLIACVNVVNLLLARGASRRGEFATRIALGAGRLRMIRQLLTESLLLAMMGGALGLFVAQFGVRALVTLSPIELPRMVDTGVNGVVFAFALGITTLIGIGVGLIPALHACRGDLNTTLQQSSRRTAGGHQWMRRTLVIAEVSLALVLLVGAGLLFRSLSRLFSIDPGFDTSQLLTMHVQASGTQFDDEKTRRFFAQSLEAVRQLPGVSAAAFSSQLPLSGDLDDGYGVKFESSATNENNIGAFRYAVSPGYLETMGIPLRRGRLLNARDTANTPPVVLISESLARSKFQDQDPLGQRLRVGANDGPWSTIVGVVGDVKQTSLTMSQTNAVYMTTEQWRLFADRALWLVVRARGEAAELAPAIRQAIWAVDKDQPIVRVATMDQRLASSAAERRFALILFEAFGFVAVVLVAVGLYGVLSASVAERTREIGVRLALGAQRRDVLYLILRQGLMLTLAGVSIGLLASWAVTRLLTNLLYGVSATDPLVFGSVASILTVVALLACYVPARRAMKVDPLVILRYE
ncbi:MAG TPA: ABC transporter permease [Pyrinomonadaceae bacterium]|nr:ABC transporter permease [Pyrinomonadaceae bacterium]